MTAPRFIAALLSLFTCKSLDALTVDANVLGFGATRNQAIEMASQEYRKYRQMAMSSYEASDVIQLTKPLTCINKDRGLYQCSLSFSWRLPNINQL